MSKNQNTFDADTWIEIRIGLTRSGQDPDLLEAVRACFNQVISITSEAWRLAADWCDAKGNKAFRMGNARAIDPYVKIEIVTAQPTNSVRVKQVAHRPALITRSRSGEQKELRMAVRRAIVRAIPDLDKVSVEAFEFVSYQQPNGRRSSRRDGDVKGYVRTSPMMDMR